MRIVYCIAGTYNSGGMERVLSNKVNFLVAHGYDIIVITTDQRNQKSFFSLDSRVKCYDLNINYEENNGKSFFNKLLHYPIKQYKHKKRLSALLKQLKPDITVSMFCNEVSFLPEIQDGSKKVLEIHFCRFKRLQYNRKGLWRLADTWRSRDEQKIVSHYDRFVTLTNEDNKYWGNIANSLVIPNAQTFRCADRAVLNQKKVIAVGRYTYQKGFDLLIHAWKIVAQQRPDWKLSIVGDGELREYLDNLIKEEQLQHSVELSPVTTNIEQIYKDASILVMSSRYEGFGMVLLEAQTVGLPTISFDCKCGPSEIIVNGENGYLIEEGDIEGMAQRVLQLIENEALRKRMGENAYNNALRFSEDVVMSKWERLFKEVVYG